MTMNRPLIVTMGDPAGVAEEKEKRKKENKDKDKKK